LASGDLIDENFFQCQISLESWIHQHHPTTQKVERNIAGLKKSLKKLKEKGVIIEC
jgi:hypothetical protein